MKKIGPLNRSIVLVFLYLLSVQPSYGGNEDVDMVFIPAGEFWMGSAEGREDEQPRPKV